MLLRSLSLLSSFWDNFYTYQSKGTVYKINKILHNSPARREDLQINGWGNRAVVYRVLQTWLNMKENLKFWLELLMSKQPSSKSCLNVQEVCLDVFTEAMLPCLVFCIFWLSLISKIF